MTPAQERWAEALHVEREHGDRAPALIAERVGELAMVGDWEGVARWKAVVDCYDQLSQGSMQ